MDPVLRAIVRHVPRDEPLIVGCSGGPDSLALADAVLRSGCDAHLVYVDHGLRPASAEEGRRVLALGPSAEVVRIAVDARHAGLEAGARTARLAALDAVAVTRGSRVVVLGHNADDQAETVLMRLLQGAGPVGLAGIPRRRGKLLRPLLDVTRAEIESYLTERGLTPVRDPMNEDRRFLRARIRHELLPALAAVNPRVSESLRRTAASAQEIDAVLDWAVDAAAGSAGSAPALAALPPLLAKRVLMATVPVRWSAKLLDAAMALIRGEHGSQALDLPGGRLVREYERLQFDSGHHRGVGPVSVDVAGEGGPFAVRQWRPGDRIRLAAGFRKLQDVFTDRKIPRRLRAEAVVVVRQIDDEVVWVEHVGHAFGATVRVALTRSHIPANSQ
jgi:tRNA(Ile)-lysidine synthase